MKKTVITFLISLLLSLVSMEGAIKHPSLLFTPERVKASKQKTAENPEYASAWEKIKAEADAALQKNDVMKLQYLALAYQMTGERKYSDKIRKMLLETSKVASWADKEMMLRKPAWRSELQMAHRSFELAVAYDAVYNDMSASERKEIAKGLYRLCVDPMLGDWIHDSTRIHSLNSMGHNWWTSCAGMGGLLALAISNELEEAEAGAEAVIEALPYWFDFAGDDVQNKPRSFDRSGGMYESINYASFGITEALIMRMAWINTHPGSKLEDIPQINKVADFFCNVAYPRTGDLYNFNFGDSHKHVTGESAVILAYAQGIKSPSALWYLSHVNPGQHREGYPLFKPMGFLYMPDLTNVPEEPGVKKSHLWEDFGWATMRNSWKKDATMLAVKSGMTWNHSHADAGSLVIFHNGVEIIKDAGNCSYGKPEYRNYFFQSDAHNVVKFNGEGQTRHHQYHGTMLPGSVSSLMDAGDIKYVLADATGPTSNHFTRNLRHFLWTDNVVLVIDDIHSHKAGSYEWLWHPGGETKKKGGELIVENGRSAAILKPLYPAELIPSNFVHDYPSLMTWDVLNGPTENLDGTEEYYSIKMPGIADRVKGVTAITLTESPLPETLPVIEKRAGENWIGLRITQGNEITDLYINQLADGRLMHLNSWINADGWDTDAYMLMLKYKRGDNPVEKSDKFICYGSSLRRDGKVHFSSLAKLNLAAKESKENLELTINGQPRIKMSYHPSRKPATVTVNGEKMKSVTTKNGLISVTTNL